jgi:hypothetical protein
MSCPSHPPSYDHPNSIFQLWLSGLWHRVDLLKVTSVSEERIASIFKAEVRILIIFGEQHKSRISSILGLSFTSFFCWFLFLVSTAVFCQNTVNICSHLKVRYQVSPPYETAEKHDNCVTLDCYQQQNNIDANSNHKELIIEINIVLLLIGIGFTIPRRWRMLSFIYNYE